MPRTTKDTKKDEFLASAPQAGQEKLKKKAKTQTTAKKSTTKATKKATSTAEKKASTSKTSAVKKTTSKTTSTKKAVNPAKATKNVEKVGKSTQKKKTTTSKSIAVKKDTTKSTTSKAKKNIDAKKETKATITAKTNTKNASTTKKKTDAAKAKRVDKNIVAEYYDLPYRYNETIVKILYQTPNVLFVYWDISDIDRENYIKKYGEYFFNDTKPVLKIFNLTKNYSFEVEINDFANSWYINVNDANCDYKVELGRKPIMFNEKITSDYIYVSSSNDIEFPNDHILLDKLPNNINFKNVKTNRITSKDISTLRLIGINKIYSVYDFYKKLYNDDILEEINNKKILCSSSSTSSWSN